MKNLKVNGLADHLIEDQTHPDVTGQEVTRHENKINNNCLNKLGKYSNNTGVIIQAQVHAWKRENGTRPQRIIFV